MSLVPATPLPLQAWLLHPAATVAAAWREIHADRDSQAAARLDGKVVGGLLLAVIILAVNFTFFSRESVRRMLPPQVSFPYKDLFIDGGWAFARFLTLACVPALYCRAIVGLPLRALGLQAPDLRTQAKSVVLLFLGLAPLLFFASTTPQFQQKYPIYALAGRSVFDFVAWETLYASQFFGIEFFYRGFLLELLRPICGAYAMLISTIPYCMVHFGKPPLEVFAAIAAGLVLGTLAQRRRSILPGFALHVMAAGGMDLLAILQKR